ncbi:pyridoxamine 5'-phosphate oxidase family protein [Nocardia nova]|uniref:Pyridoxamine 5'-phosphate oxidase family protein n=1 Tax=Nocardia nova TaxID=37330 RepID=A0A2S6AUL2_9NOCA|nr:pyridoxamine 5'-phosphate oxidase family protein [Nocardia nova]PPJ31023.1 pyridoxamine 5'-phosphate oxidase family protein [Nocardia nova]PPJ38900.1 pyridoxamine 5'-phosphate oxidase family protein [Nocardia nova]
MVALERAEAMRLLAGIAYGRVVFTRDALPAIRPVNHFVEADGRVVVRTRLTSRLTSAIRADPGVVVAYEADEIDPGTRTGWSVVVTGLARPVADPNRVARYERLLPPWIAAAMDTVVEIEPTIVTGIRLVGAPDTPGPPAPPTLSPKVDNHDIPR